VSLGQSSLAAEIAKVSRNLFRPHPIALSLGPLAGCTGILATITSYTLANCARTDSADREFAIDAGPIASAASRAGSGKSCQARFRGEERRQLGRCTVGFEHS
jgi:hypothetical protein